MTRPRLVVGAAALAASLLVATIAFNTSRWIGTTFPGFFVVSNRVVPSVTLPGWAGGEAPRFFQRQVTTLDDVPVRSAAALYADVAARPPGTPVRYTFRGHAGTDLRAVVAAQRFSLWDYLMLFGVYLVTASTFLATGLIVVGMVRTPASFGLLALTLVTGTFIATACDLYGPHWFVPIHVLAESLLGVAAIHLAVVFPAERLHRWRRPLLASLYGAGTVFGVAYVAWLSDPDAYTAFHLVASASHALGAGVLVGCILWDLFRGRSPLLRRKVGVAAAGMLASLLLPALLMGASALLDGSVPLNLGAFSAFFFPVSIGWAVLQQDLFEIDRILRRAVAYAIVLVLIASAYLGLLALPGVLLPANAFVSSPLSLAMVNLFLVFAMAPLRARVQGVVDRVYFRQGYDATSELSNLSRALVALQTENDVFDRVREVLRRTVSPTKVSVLRVGADDAALLARLESRTVVARYEWDVAGAAELPPVFVTTEADLLVAVGPERPLVVLAIGGKENGRPYTLLDIEFLRSLAGQVALALTNAYAFARLDTLNARLEMQVADRTASLADANESLQRSLRQLKDAYERLEQNQASLARTERLATLGRLTAGIAHEVNTPLGAVLNALKLLGDLGDEYTRSIDVPTVTQEDHRQIAREITDRARAALDWTRRAIAFVNRVRIHGRQSGSVGGSFALATAFEETEALLAHRARAVDVSLDFSPALALAIDGDPVRLGQVLLNLVQNALDAYEESDCAERRVHIAARRSADLVVITVADRAGGIPADVLPRIFEELFTTKGPGRGTGLGLSIARSIVEHDFGGTLVVDVEPDVGSRFTITVPVARREDRGAAAEAIG
jgi:signal transduction histidine kinase